MAGRHPLADTAGTGAHAILGSCTDADRHWLLGGGSGHGFKHAPALGELLANAIEEKREAPGMLAPGPRAARPELTGR
jgi:glycine/D-amino acid oxidase-like deaminating enzyme